ncbi:hypothetical protein Hamer_G029632, partial [Homarus americanus]
KKSPRATAAVGSGSAIRETDTKNDLCGTTVDRRSVAAPETGRRVPLSDSFNGKRIEMRRVENWRENERGDARRILVRHCRVGFFGWRGTRRASAGGRVRRSPCEKLGGRAFTLQKLRNGIFRWNRGPRRMERSGSTPTDRARGSSAAHFVCRIAAIGEHADRSLARLHFRRRGVWSEATRSRVREYGPERRSTKRLVEIQERSSSGIRRASVRAHETTRGHSTPGVERGYASNRRPAESAQETRSLTGRSCPTGVGNIISVWTGDSTDPGRGRRSKRGSRGCGRERRHESETDRTVGTSERFGRRHSGTEDEDASPRRRRSTREEDTPEHGKNTTFANAGRYSST